MEKQSNVKGFTILGAASMINKVLGVLYVPAVTLIIGNYGNGIYEQGYKLYQMAFVITNTGIPIALSKIISELLASHKYNVSYRTLRITAWLLTAAGALTSVLTAVLALPMAKLMHSPESFLTIVMLSPAMLFTSVSCIFRGYFQGRSNMIPTSISQVAEQAVNAVVTVAFAWLAYKYGVKIAVARGITGDAAIFTEAVKYAAAGAAIGTTAGALASMIYLFRIYARKKAEIIAELPYSSTDGSEYTTGSILRTIFVLGVPITLGSLSVYATQLIDVINIKTKLIAAGFSEVEATSMYGILSTQYTKVLFIPITLATALGTAILPSISAADAVNNRALLHRRITNAFRILFMIAVPAAVGLTVMAKPIVYILFPKSPDGWDLLVMGSWTLIVISLVSVQTSVLQGMGKTYVPTIHMVIGLVLKLAVNYTLISVRSINIRGAIIGNAVCYIFAAVMNYRSLKKLTGVRLNVRKLFIRPLSVSIIMGLFVYLIYNGFIIMTEWFIRSGFVLNVICGFAAIAVGCLIYYLLMIIAGGISASDIRSLPMGERILSYTAVIPYMDRYLT